MNLDKFRPKNGTEDLLLSKFKNCETLFKQTHTKPQGTLEFRLIKPRWSFSLKPSLALGLDVKWMIEITSLEVYKSNLNITEEKDKLQLYADAFHEFLFTKLKDELEEILAFSDISPAHLQDKKITAFY